eukprot:2404577-Rhodomonas_salina.1
MLARVAAKPLRAVSAHFAMTAAAPQPDCSMNVFLDLSIAVHTQSKPTGIKNPPSQLLLTPTFSLSICRFPSRLVMLPPGRCKRCLPTNTAQHCGLPPNPSCRRCLELGARVLDHEVRGDGCQAARERHRAPTPHSRCHARP